MIVLLYTLKKLSDSENILNLPPRRTLSLSLSRDKKGLWFGRGKLLISKYMMLIQNIFIGHGY
jgi:hypothetical protein